MCLVAGNTHSCALLTRPFGNRSSSVNSVPISTIVFIVARRPLTKVYPDLVKFLDSRTLLVIPLRSSSLQMNTGFET